MAKIILIVDDQLERMRTLIETLQSIKDEVAEQVRIEELEANALTEMDRVFKLPEDEQRKYFDEAIEQLGIEYKKRELDIPLRM